MGFPPMQPEHKAKILADYARADEILAHHLGSQTPVRLALAKERERILANQ